MEHFSGDNRGDLQPTRSLPLSALRERERSDLPQQRRRSRRIISSDNKQESPNPYSSRSEIVRARSQSYDFAMRSSSSSSSNSSKKYEASRFRLVLSILALLMVGFGGGLVYNKYYYDYIWEKNNTSADANMATDELVKKLARENQEKEQEIDSLKRQVEEAKKRQSSEEQNNNNKATEEQQPQFVAIGRYDENGVFHKYKEARPVGGGLRASNRMESDNDKEMIHQEKYEDVEERNEEHEKVIDDEQPDEWDRQQE